MSLRLRLMLLALMLLAFALRVYRLDAQSLWSDEGLSLYRARLSLSENLTNVVVVPPGVPTQDTNPPLYFILLSGLRAVVGESEFALRFLSVMAGVIVVPLLYVAGKRLFSMPVGVAAAALCALSPFFVWYSQEARMYTLLAALSLASVHWLVRALAPPRSLAKEEARRRWMAWIVVTVAALYTHFTMFFLLAFEVAVIFVTLARKTRQLLAQGTQPIVDERGSAEAIGAGPRNLRPEAWRQAIIAGMGLALAAAPMIIYGWSRARVTGDAVFGFRPLDSILEEVWSAFSIGSPIDHFQPWWAVTPALAMFVLGAVDGFVRQPRQVASALMALGYVFVTLLLFYAVTFMHPLYTGPRHLTLLAPPFYLLVGNGLVAAWRRGRVVSVAVAAWIVVSMGAWLIVQFFDPAYLKDDMRSVARVVSERAQVDDVVIVHDAISSFVFEYYYDGSAPWRIIPTYPSLDVGAALTEFEAQANAAARVWFVTEPPPLHGFPRNILDEWARGHLLRLDHQRFPSLWLGSAYQLYTARFPILAALPASAEGRDFAWQGGLRLVGVTFALVPGKGSGELYWKLDAPVDGNFVATFRVVDAAGRVWLDRADRMFDNWSARRWPVGMVIRQDMTLDLPLDLPPGEYAVHVSIADRESGRSILLADGSGEVVIISIKYAGINE